MTYRQNKKAAIELLFWFIVATIKVFLFSYLRDKDMGIGQRLLISMNDGFFSAIILAALSKLLQSILRRADLRLNSN